MSVWLIGAGQMAIDYGQVLLGMGKDFEVIGRGSASAQKFEKEVGKSVYQNGVTTALKELAVPETAIVAVGIEMLASVAIELIKSGVCRILIEKPAGLSTKDVNELHDVAVEYDAEVLVAYNRRFYASTIKAKQLIENDGGATSCTFEFTEWSHIIGPSKKGLGVKEAWFTGNSSHVADLAFYLCGFPKDWKAWHGGSLDWHTRSARFCGAGITELGVYFSYSADWEAPGRWSVEVLTRKNRYIFRPMEQLHVTPIGTVRIDGVDIDDKLDIEYKPGLYKQVDSFLSHDDEQFCSLQEQLEHCGIYDEMAGYN